MFYMPPPFPNIHDMRHIFDSKIGRFIDSLFFWFFFFFFFFAQGYIIFIGKHMQELDQCFKTLLQDYIWISYVHEVFDHIYTPKLPMAYTMPILFGLYYSIGHRPIWLSVNLII